MPEHLGSDATAGTSHTVIRVLISEEPWFHRVLFQKGLFISYVCRSLLTCVYVSSLSATATEHLGSDATAGHSHRESIEPWSISQGSFPKRGFLWHVYRSLFQKRRIHTSKETYTHVNRALISQGSFPKEVSCDICIGLFWHAYSSLFQMSHKVNRALISQGSSPNEGSFDVCIGLFWHAYLSLFLKRNDMLCVQVFEVFFALKKCV